MVDVLVPVLAAIGGFAGVASLVTAIVRGRSGARVDEADAADKTVHAAVSVVELLRADIIDARATAAAAGIEARAAQVATELCEHGRDEDRKHMLQQTAQIAVLTDRVDSLHKMVMAQVGAPQQVQVMNAPDDPVPIVPVDDT